MTRTQALLYSPPVVGLLVALWRHRVVVSDHLIDGMIRLCARKPGPIRLRTESVSK